MLKTFATVLLILASMVGFVFSYEFAYNKIARLMNLQQDQQLSPNWIVKK